MEKKTTIEYPKYALMKGKSLNDNADDYDALWLCVLLEDIYQAVAVFTKPGWASLVIEKLNRAEDTT